MGPLVNSAATVFITSLWTSLFGLSSVFCQDLRERDALCTAEGCYMVYFQRKTFLDSWRACKEKGGNLATIKRRDEAQTIATLFSTVDLRYSRTKVQVWIGLQRQPRQCTKTRPLRGFSWTTGDQDTDYTNWLKEDSPSMCSVPRCVAMGYSNTEPDDNFKWLDGSCSVPVEAYLCYYGYRQMCLALPSEGVGSVLYNTPFNLLSTLLTHVPFGSVATVPCPTKEETVLCMLQDSGLASWSKNSPICVDVPLQYNWCDDANGGCEHFCKQTGEHYFCECADGYQLGLDGQSCELQDDCEKAQCEFECLLLSDGVRCACPEGYMLAPDERGCLDVDECLQSPCEQLCVNAPGSFACMCRDGYQPGVESECDDVDECINDPCEHACENTLGSRICHCHMGYSPLPEDPSRCQDIDECQIPGMCQQLCVNYEGGYECYCEMGYELMADLNSCQKIGIQDSQYVVTPAFPWATHQPPTAEEDTEDYDWTLQQAHNSWPTKVDQSLEWLTDVPKVVDSDIIWVTRSPQEEHFNEGLNFPTEAATDYEDRTVYSDIDWVQWGQHVPSENVATASPTMSPSSPVSTTTSDWYEAEEETTTAPPSPLPTSTVSEGAWNWWAPMASPSQVLVNEDPDYNVAPDYDYEVLTDPRGVEPDPVTPHSPGAKEEIENDYEDNAHSPEPAFPTESSPAQDSFGTVVDLDSMQSDSGQRQSSTWLLVGLLVPICIFVLVMVALGIVYCTRCTLQSRNKNTTDCYHWISGAHDKQGAPNPSLGVKTHV